MATAIAVDSRLVAPRFTLEEAERASDEWGVNCGPAVLAMIAGLKTEEVRPFLGDFERKRYTNPTLMFECLRRLDIPWVAHKTGLSDHCDSWPYFGLARVQWEGPWTAPGVPIRVRYRHTHWIGVMRVEGKEPNIFDVNCMHECGWVLLSEWEYCVVPWILKHAEPKADGKWHLTHAIEVEPK